MRIMDKKMEATIYKYMVKGVPSIRVPFGGWYHFGGPYNKDYSIGGSILRSPSLGKLLYGL